MATYIVSCRGIGQLGGVVPVIRLGVPLRCKACRLGDPLSYPLDNDYFLLQLRLSKAGAALTLFCKQK